MFLVMPLVATVAYTLAVLLTLAAWAILTGTLEIVAAIRLRKEIEGEWLLALSGAISILLGLGVLVLVVPNPAASILSAAWLIALFAFGTGVVLISQALRLRRKASLN
jgi:uncharacterized membrane protein HdeD (DUF308 family)